MPSKKLTLNPVKEGALKKRMKKYVTGECHRIFNKAKAENYKRDRGENPTYIAVVLNGNWIRKGTITAFITPKEFKRITDRAAKNPEDTSRILYIEDAE